MQRMLAEEVPLDKPVWGVHNDASRGLEAGARFGDLISYPNDRKGSTAIAGKAEGV